MADMIIPDLARWEDWSVVERLVQMFKDADDETNWLRVPVITYLRACPKPEAKQYIEELREIDPDAVRRADFFLDFDDDSEGWGDEEEDGEEEGEAEEKEGDGKKVEQKQADDSQGSGGSGVAKDDTANEEGDQAASDGRPEPGDQGKITPAPSTDGAPAGSLTRTRTHYLSVSTPLNEEPTGTTTSALPHKVRKPMVDQGAGSLPGANQGPPVAVTGTGTSLIPEGESRKVAQANPATAPVGMIDSSTGLTWQILLIPMAASILIFLLLWSVFNGWFERLIY